MFDIDWAAVLRPVLDRHCFAFHWLSHLVGLMVVLRIILEDLGLLLVVKVACEVVNAEFFSPFFAVYEPALPSASEYVSCCKVGSVHLLGRFDIEFSCAQEPELPMIRYRGAFGRNT